MTFQSQLDDETLEAYREYLSKNLVFPFAAEHGAEYGHPERVKVIGLGDEYEVVVEEYDSSVSPRPILGSRRCLRSKAA